MFAIRHALGWGLLLLTVNPALAQSVDESELRMRPFHDVAVASFDEVWQESDTAPEILAHPIELASHQESTVTDPGVVTATSLSETPRLLPESTTLLASHLTPPDSIPAMPISLIEWFFGMLGCVGVVALGGVYWIYQVRPALDARHTTGRLQLSSALPLPRRPGLFLIDVEDQAVLVAIDGGGIRQVVPLGTGGRVKSSSRRAADSSQRASDGSKPAEVLAFQDVYQEQRALAP